MRKIFDFKLWQVSKVSWSINANIFDFISKYPEYERTFYLAFAYKLFIYFYFPNSLQVYSMKTFEKL